MIKNPYIIIIALLLIFNACGDERDKWKQPSAVDFRIDLNREATNSGNLRFIGGSIVLSEFSFEGERLQGEDYYFDKPFPEGLEVKLSSSNAPPELKFDIPQGNYTQITIEFEAETEDDKSIIIEGTYTNSSGTSYPVLLEIEADEIFTVIAKDASGGREIVLNKDIPSTATIILDPVYWFGHVSTSMLDNADLVELNGRLTILINEEENEDILDEIEDRIDEATEVKFN